MTQTLLTSNQNLADIDDPVAARSNLGVYPVAEVYTKQEVENLIASRLGTSSKWHTGTGVPPMGLGNADDMYLDLDSGDIHEKTGATTWILKGNIKPTALDGVKGLNGTPAQDGANGTDGTDGAPGEASDGSPGATVSSIYISSPDLPVIGTDDSTFDGIIEVAPTGWSTSPVLAENAGDTVWVSNTRWVFMGLVWENTGWSTPVPYVKDYTEELNTVATEATENFLSEFGRDFAADAASLRNIEMEQLITTANEAAAVEFQGETNVFVEAANTSLASQDAIITSHSQRIYTALPNDINNAYAQSINYTKTALAYCLIGGSVSGHNSPSACASAGGTWYEGPLAENVKNLSVGTSSGTASITQIAQAFEGSGGSLIARGGVLTDVNGFVSGFINSNNGSVGSFDILANVFRVGTVSGSTFTPYLYLDGSVLKFVGDISGASGTFNGRVDGENLVGSTDSPLAAVSGLSTHTHGVAVYASNSGGGTAVQGIGGSYGGLFSASSAGGRGCSASGADYAFYAAGGTASNFAPFTGSHEGLIPKSSDAQVGDLIVDTGLANIAGWSDAICYMDKSTYSNQKNTRGLLINRLPINPEVLPNGLEGVDLDTLQDYDLAIFNALGEGVLEVCGQNGNISAGDLLTTSDIQGKAMKQEAQDNYKPYTIAQARQDIEFNSPDEVKQIAVIYKMG